MILEPPRENLRGREVGWQARLGEGLSLAMTSAVNVAARPRAVAAYRSALKINPRLLTPYAGLGELLSRAKDEKGAEEVFRQGTAADPKLAGELEEYRENYVGGIRAGAPAKLDRWRKNPSQRRRSDE